MSYRFKPWLDEHVTKLRRALANQQGGGEQEQPKLSRPLLRPESEVVELSKVSGTFLTEAPLVGSWPLGWSELPCVCVCVFQLGLWAGEARQGTVGVSSPAQRTCWSPVSEGLLQQILTEGDPMTLGSCTPGSQRRGTCASCSWTSSSSATSS